MKWWLFVGIYAVILIPLFRNNEILQTIKVSSDMHAHVGYVTGENTNYLYGGQVFLKYLLYPFRRSSSLGTIYLWFNFTALFGSVLSIYYVVKKLVNKLAAYLSVAMMFVVATGILGLFKYGVIFNIINMYIIFPFAVLFIVYWLTGKGNLYGILGFIALAVFSVFHATGMYLPVILAVSFIGYVTISLYRGTWWQWEKLVLLFGISFLMMMVLLPFNINHFGLQSHFDLNALRLVYDYAHFYLFIIIGIVLPAWFYYRHRMGLKVKVFLFIMGATSIALLLGLVFEVNQHFNRIAIDFSSILAMITACLASLVWKKHYLIRYGTVAIIGATTIPNLITWVR